MTIYPRVYAEREKERIFAELDKLFEEKTSSAADDWVPQLVSFETLAAELFGFPDNNDQQ